MLKTPLPPQFFQRKTERVAQDLLGKIVLYRSPRFNCEVSGRIVETEAYLGLKDPAAHSFHGKVSKRTEVFYKEGGHIYVYLIYGMYHCLNFITRTAHHPEAVLIRALEPLEGLDLMLKAENKTKANQLLNGPGKLCRAMGIDTSINGTRVGGDELQVIDDGHKIRKSNITHSSRIGVEYAGEAARWPLRYYVSDSAFVSKK